jgi:hypothetical protein
MKTSEFKHYLEQYPDHELRFVLPDNDMVPIHAHITEAGRIDKTFVDCGGTVRKISNVTLQAWIADDIDHRLSPGKLAGVMNIAAPIFGGDDLEVEIEYEDCSISQFPVLTASVDNSALAKDICLPQTGAGCGPGCC